MTFWLNGNYCEDERAISIADRGFLLGDGVFETLLVDGGTPAFLDEHLARLKSGLAALRIDAAIPDNLGSIIRALAKENRLTDGLAAARITVSRGPSGRGLAFPAAGASKPSVLVTLTGAPASRDDAATFVIISRFMRAEASIAARCKTMNYLDNILARNEALDAGAGEAAMLNGKGRVAGASSANIFVTRDGGAATPSVEEGALPGVVRGLLLQGAAETGVDVGERAVAAEELRAGGFFLTNSLIGLHMARLKDGAAPTATQTEIFNTLKAWYHRRLRENLTERNAAP